MTTYPMPEIGDVLADKYRIEEVAGEGGMGVVYAAEHLVLNQRVAVKVLHPDAASAEGIVERFAREARAAARIVSEHVVRVMDAGSLESGAPFLVMEFLEGCNLQEFVENDHDLDVEDIVDFGVQALEAMAHAHALGIVHRDIKPANLFLAKRPDGSEVIKVLDFGISKTMKAKPGEKVLTGHAVLGSPVFMSPEQLRNAKEIDGRADLWSLGVVLYELLTKRLPFDGEGVGEIFAAILEHDAEPVTVYNPDVPQALSDAIAKALRRNPAERHADAAEFARAIAPFGPPTAGLLVERARQVLDRARELRVTTPFEARVVVEAISAAAQRAAASFPPPSPSTRLAPSSRRGKRRSPRARVAWIAAAICVAATSTFAVAAVHSRVTSEDEAHARATKMAVAPKHATRTVQEHPDSVHPSRAEPLGSVEVVPPPLVLELPEDKPTTSPTPSHWTGAKPVGTRRPKFLQSRE